MTEKEKEKLFLQNRGMIKAMARKVSKTSNVEVEELEAQGNLIFCECLEKYDNQKGSFEKFFNSYIWGLYKYVRKKAEEEQNQEGLEFIDFKKHYSDPDIFDVCMNDLSRDAKMLVDTVLYGMKENPERRINKTIIRDYAREKFNWTHKQVDRAFYEIANIL
jgi:hypothetical protein